MAMAEVLSHLHHGLPHKIPDSPWESTPSFGRTGAETLAASAPIRSRARYFVANNPWAANAVNALVAGLVGTGVTPASAHPAPATRARIGAAFAAWARDCDADGRTDLFGLQAAATRALVADGEAFLHLEQTRKGLRLRLLPAEMIDESDTRELGGGAHRIAGIEFDAAGDRTAYMVLPRRPTDIFASTAPAFRIPAQDMIHVMAPIGAGQVRGVSWLAPILLRLAELDALEDALRWA